MEDNKLGSTLKMLRLRKGMTQAELSKVSGIYQNQISNYEKGNRSPSPKIAEKLLAALDAPAEYWESFQKTAKTEYPALAENIKKLRQNMGLTQTELAKIIGTTQAKLSGYENGLHIPNPIQLTRLAAFFGVNVEQLLMSSVAYQNSNSNYDIEDYDWQSTDRIEEISAYCPAYVSNENKEDIGALYLRLTEENQKKAIDFIHFLLSKQ